MFEAFIVGFFLFFAGLVYKIWQYEDHPAPQARETLFFQYRTVIMVLSVPILTFLVATHIIGDPEIVTAEEKIEYGKRLDDDALLKEGYREILKDDPNNVRAHVSLALDLLYHQSKGQTDLEMHINTLYKQESDSLYEIAQLLSAFYLEKTGELEKAKVKLHSMKLKDLFCRWVLLGDIQLGLSQVDSSIISYKKELELDGWTNRAASQLYEIYIFTDNEAGIRNILDNEELVKHIDPWMLRQFHFANFEIIPYWISALKITQDKLSFYSFGGSTLILFLWLLFMYRLDIYERDPIRFLLLAVILGAIFSFGVYLYSDINRQILGNRMNGEPINDWLYMVFGVGFIEEFVKLVPALLIVYFSKQVDEPYDYLLYASASAAGFAWAENFLYLEHVSYTGFSVRGLLAAVGHMIDSSVAIYGFVLVRYNKKSWIYIPLYFMLASFIHGTWNSMPNIFILVVYYVILLRLWTQLINNCLNNSPFFHEGMEDRADHLRFYLITGIVFLLSMEHMFAAAYFGASNANDNILMKVFMGGIPLLILASNLTRLKFEQHRWEKVDNFFSGIFIKVLTFGAIGMSKDTSLLDGSGGQHDFYEPDELLGRKLKISPHPNSKTAAQFLGGVVYGTVMKSIGMRIDEDFLFFRNVDEGWIVLKTEHRLPSPNYHPGVILLYFKQGAIYAAKDADIANIASLAMVKDAKVLDGDTFDKYDAYLVGAGIVSLVE